MGNLYFVFTPSAPSRPKGVLCVVVACKGTSQGRKSYIIDGVINPDFRYWDKKAQCFQSGTDTARVNNPVLDALRTRCNELLTNTAITTPDGFIDALKSGIAPTLTLGSFLRYLIDDMRSGKNNKKPSRNYQSYITILHKLEREGQIIETPINEINNAHFIAFSDFLLSLSDSEGKSNYISLMKRFKAIHTKAYERELNDNVLRFKYTDHAPVKEDKEKMPSLTMEQYDAFVNLDVTTLSLKGYKSTFYPSLYKDFCVFLYETMSRPVDVIKFKYSNIEKHDGMLCLKYVPEKKKNNRSKNKVVLMPLSPIALAIIDKYKGKSKGGYIFPFGLNEYDWDMSDNKSWNTWNNRKARAIEMVNKWLKKAEKALKLDFALTTYSFRRSTLTHKCAVNPNYMQIALCAGTSPDMLVKNYVTATVSSIAI
ncbi:MAG: hypothetical protein DBY35_08730 [Bacteroidales bacterium]|nr:MAG: hypothetical protein DBY35_08730 [Bacteroidales bacterium]